MTCEWYATVHSQEYVHDTFWIILLGKNILLLCWKCQWKWSFRTIADSKIVYTSLNLYVDEERERHTLQCEWKLVEKHQITGEIVHISCCTVEHYSAQFFFNIFSKNNNRTRKGILNIAFLLLFLVFYLKKQNRIYWNDKEGGWCSMNANWKCLSLIFVFNYLFIMIDYRKILF